MALKYGDLILFQGDSITDCQRNRADGNDLGGGYPKLVASALSALRPDLGLQFLNRGISGDRTNDLLARWDADCLALRPALLSIFIGINDIWHRYGGRGLTDAQLEENYTELLSRTRSTLGDIPIIIMEPFLTPDSTATLTRAEVDEVRPIIRRLAETFNAVFVPLDEPLAKAAEAFPPATITQEGVHPTSQGHAIIAKHWLDAALPLL